MHEQQEACIRLGDYWKGSRGKQFQNNFVFIRDDGSQMHICSPRTEFKRVIQINNTNIVKDETETIPDDLTLHDLRHPYVKHTTKNKSLQKQKSQAIKEF